jgi:hypothetical protein
LCILLLNLRKGTLVCVETGWSVLLSITKGKDMKWIITHVEQEPTPICVMPVNEITLVEYLTQPELDALNVPGNAPLDI